ncbi:YJR011C [Zygosaccharomyces parabailii]|nr:YJR011C [Zygosaccharomyces parabailii]CDH15482.1 uncharacterized protein ZBAI_07269 [Zygosaccharomyces bailii ISA1307]
MNSSESEDGWLPLRRINQDMVFEDKKNILLSNQIILFVLNTSHYMTDLIYALYFLSFCERKGSNEPESGTQTEDHRWDVTEQLAEIRKQLYALVYQVRTNFRQLLDECKHTRVESAPKFRRLVDWNLVCVLGVINDLLISEMRHLSMPLALQLHNCMMGFSNLYQFLKKIPLQHQYQITKPQLDVLLHALGTELIPSWKLQLDLLNYKLFSTLSCNDSIVEEYRKSTGDTRTNLKSGDGFKVLVNWLKDEIIGDVTL